MAEQVAQVAQLAGCDVRLGQQVGAEQVRERAGVDRVRLDDGERSEFVMVTLWESWEAVRAFAGEDVERAVFYPEDDAYLIERDLVASHYEVADARNI